jgi:pantoate--beta-alanine ligase
LLDIVKEIIAKEPLARLEYVQVVRVGELASVMEIEGEALVAASIWVGETRLIDNFIFKP